MSRDETPDAGASTSQMAPLGDERPIDPSAKRPTSPGAKRLTVAVRILDREYEVRCAEDEVAGLKASASELDGRMRAIRDGRKVAGTDRVAIMAALNLAHENLQLRSNEETAAQRVVTLAERLATAIEKRTHDA